MELRPTLKNYITAKSPMGLRRLMLQNNAKKGFTFKYSDIQFVKGKWYAWYDEYISNAALSEDLDGTTMR